jgi:hypothetical protein
MGADVAAYHGARNNRGHPSLLNAIIARFRTCRGRGLMIPCSLTLLKVVLVVMLVVVSYARSNRQDRGPATKMNMWVILWVEQRLVCGAGARPGAHLILAYHTRCGV